MLSLRRAPVFAVVTLEQLARVRVTGDLLFDGIKVDDSINARRDVAEMAQRGSAATERNKKMADKKIGEEDKRGSIWIWLSSSCPPFSGGGLLMALRG